MAGLGETSNYEDNNGFKKAQIILNEGSPKKTPEDYLKMLDKIRRDEEKNKPTLPDLNLETKNFKIPNSIEPLIPQEKILINGDIISGPFKETGFVDKYDKNGMLTRESITREYYEVNGVRMSTEEYQRWERQKN